MKMCTSILYQCGLPGPGVDGSFHTWPCVHAYPCSACVSWRIYIYILCIWVSALCACVFMFKVHIFLVSAPVGVNTNITSVEMSLTTRQRPYHGSDQERPWWWSPPCSSPPMWQLRYTWASSGFLHISKTWEVQHIYYNGIHMEEAKKRSWTRVKMREKDRHRCRSRRTGRRGRRERYSSQ